MFSSCLQKCHLPELWQSRCLGFGVCCLLHVAVPAFQIPRQNSACLQVVQLVSKCGEQMGEGVQLAVLRALLTIGTAEHFVAHGDCLIQVWRSSSSLQHFGRGCRDWAMISCLMKASWLLRSHHWTTPQDQEMAISFDRCVPLQVVRTAFNVAIGTESEEIKRTAKNALLQMLNTIVRRVTQVPLVGPDPRNQLQLSVPIAVFPNNCHKYKGLCILEMPSSVLPQAIQC